ncbi:MAG: plasmid pRiA4b ORF-3 family protein [Chitinophagaceae bacterium]|nr:plasmid pRiA4b ORF-3 family protein [Chitinophagaceae bacterium]
MATYTLKISISNIEPQIFRTVNVSSESSLYLLHHIIQIVMGWKNYHLYHFDYKNLNIGDLRLLESDGYDDGEIKLAEGKNYMLEDVLTEIGQKIEYIYDYGDYWEHEIELIAISHTPQIMGLPLLLDGNNTCPPEDCGGVHGYKEMLEVLKNSRHPEFISTLEWLGGKFNPDVCKVDSINKELQKLNGYIRFYEKGFTKR